MQTIINEGQEGTFKSVNISHRVRGWLAHDNKFFDRTCPQCRGMYSSHEGTTHCPKCNAQLTYITDKRGTPMGVSEGTFYPVLSQKQKEKDLAITKAKQGGVDRVYRFKMYSFAQGNVLAPPEAHAFCKKSAMVEIHIVNHQTTLSLFMSKQNQAAMAEEIYHIWENYGDSVKLVQGPKVHDAVISYPVNADGSAKPVDVGGGQTIEQMMQTLQNLQRQLDALQPSGELSEARPVEQNFAAGAAGAVDPFNGII